MVGGRTLNPVWHHFERITTNPKNVKAKCKGCKAEFQGIPTRMEKHVEVCAVLNVSLKRARDDDDSDTPHAEVVKRHVGGPIDRCTIRTTNAELHELNLQLTRAVVASNSCFSLVENKHMKMFFDKMRPGVQLAGRHAISGQLLDEVYEQELAKAKDFLKGKCLLFI